jgi:hypothetical protein
MRAKLVEIAGGLFLGLVLLAASVGVTVVIGRVTGNTAAADPAAEAHAEAAR